MTSDQNKYTCLIDSGAQVSTISLEHAKELELELIDGNGNIVETTSTKKKSCYSKLQKQLKRLENKFDILDNDLIELKWKIDDIKKNLSQTKSKKKKPKIHEVILDVSKTLGFTHSNSSD